MQAINLLVRHYFKFKKNVEKLRAIRFIYFNCIIYLASLNEN